MNNLIELSRDEMRNIKAGGICHLYCCSSVDGSCSEHGRSYPSEATTNEGCQEDAVNNGATCGTANDEWYIAALYF